MEEHTGLRLMLILTGHMHLTLRREIRIKPVNLSIRPGLQLLFFDGVLGRPALFLCATVRDMGLVLVNALVVEIVDCMSALAHILGKALTLKLPNMFAMDFLSACPATRADI